MRRLVMSVTMNDCEMQVFRTGGNGGQHRDKTSNAVRIIHHPSGARGECSEDRSQMKNKRTAFERMAAHPKFKLWLNQQLMLETPEERVARDMNPRNLKVEVKENGKWVEE